MGDSATDGQVLDTARSSEEFETSGLNLVDLVGNLNGAAYYDTGGGETDLPSLEIPEAGGSRKRFGDEDDGDVDPEPNPNPNPKPDPGPNPFNKNFGGYAHPEQRLSLLSQARNAGVRWPPARILG
jgi:hypothetical protein